MAGARDDVDVMRLPVNVEVAIAGESACLRIWPDGADLRIRLCEADSSAQVESMLRNGFASALMFDAGLAAGASELLLTQWLPGVTGWTGAAEPLARILLQVQVWRSSNSPGSDALRPDWHLSNDERRMRDMLASHGR